MRPEIHYLKYFNMNLSIKKKLSYILNIFLQKYFIVLV